METTENGAEHAYEIRPGWRVRINIERTSTNKFRIEKTIEIADFGMFDRDAFATIGDAMVAVNDVIEADMADLDSRIARRDERRASND